MSAPPNSTKLGTKTANQVIRLGQTLLSSYTEEIVPKKSWLNLLNDAVAEYHEIAGMRNKEQYKESVELVKYGSGGVIFSPVVSLPYANYKYVESTKQLWLGPDNAGIQGVIWMTTQTVDDGWIGARVIWSIGDASSVPKYDIVTAAVIQAHEIKLTLKTGWGSDIAAGNLAGAIMKALTIENGYVDLSHAGYGTLLSRIDQITSIEDELTGLYLEKSEKDFIAIQKPGDANTEYAEEVCWYRKGHKLRFCKGSEVDAYGTPILNYYRNPIPMEAYSDLIDIPNGTIRTILDMVMIKVIQTETKKPLPQELASANSDIMKMKEATFKERAALNKPE